MLRVLADTSPAGGSGRALVSAGTTMLIVTCGAHAGPTAQDLAGWTPLCLLARALAAVGTGRAAVAAVATIGAISPPIDAVVRAEGLTGRAGAGVGGGGAVPAAALPMRITVLARGPAVRGAGLVRRAQPEESCCQHTHEDAEGLAAGGGAPQSLGQSVKPVRVDHRAPPSLHSAGEQKTGARQQQSWPVSPCARCRPRVTKQEQASESVRLY
jgi:hypothetical protein